MLSIASGITGHGMLEILVPMLGHAFRFATPENEWRDLFLPYLPEWLIVSDSKVARRYYAGEVNLYHPRTANRYYPVSFKDLKIFYSFPWNLIRDQRVGCKIPNSTGRLLFHQSARPPVAG